MTGLPSEKTLEQYIWIIIREIYRSNLTPQEVETLALTYIKSIFESDNNTVRKCIMFPTFDSMGRAVTLGINLLNK
jgi:hypothetical protein